MPINTRHLALETLLLMILATLICMGVVGVVVGISIPTQPFFATLVPDGALVTLLVGVGLLASLQGWVKTRMFCAVMLLIIIIYTVVHNSLEGSGGGSWLSSGPRITSLSAGFLLLTGVCFWVGLSTSWRRRLWVVGGLSLLGLALFVVGKLWFGLNGASPLFSSSPMTALVFTCLLGTAMLAAGLRGKTQRLNPGRVTVAASLWGVTISCFIWLLVNSYQQTTLRQQAAYLLDNVQLNIEQATQERLRLMQRMAERLNAMGPRWDLDLLESDAQNYLRDTPSISAIALIDKQQLTWSWGVGRTAEMERWLRQQLREEYTRAWIQIPLERPRLLMADTSRPHEAMFVIPIPANGHYLFASFDLATMLENELRLEVGPFQVRVNRDATSLVKLHPVGFSADSMETPELALASRYIGLPGGINMELYAYPGSQYNWYQLNLLPFAVALGSLLLSGLLAFSLGVVSVSIARARELAQTRQALEDQQAIQRMIAQEQPLPEILESLCRMLERELPQAICSVMLVNDAGTHLEFAAGNRLPAAYRNAVQRILISANNGACGSAAYQGSTVICANIAEDERWRGYHGVAKEAGLASCWSSPVYGGEGHLVGTIAVYYPRPSTPTVADTAQIEKAAGLLALAIERFQVRRSLEESEQRYRSLFTHHPDAVFTLDDQGCFVTANATCATLTGYSVEEMLGKPFTFFITEQDMTRVQAYIETAMRGGIDRYELTLKDRAGHLHLLEIIHLPMMVNDTVKGVHVIAQEVTAAREQEARLRTLERSVEASFNGILIADAEQPDLPIIYANKACTAVTGYSQEEILGKNCRFLQGPESDPAVVQLIRSCIEAKREVNVTICNYRKDGTPFWNDLYIAPVRDHDGRVTHFVGVQHDISKHKAYEAQLAYHASHDDLTRLPNRTLFEEALFKQFATLRQHKKRLAVLFVDLDDFKPINDNLGHAVGDQVLVEVARRLNNAVGPEDTVARMGGDEFVILQTGIDYESEVVDLVERMLPMLARPYRIESQELYLTASIGIAISQEDTLQPQTLIQQADMAMYKAKQQGRNAYEWFTHAFTDTVSERMVLRNDLQEAIEREEFALHYQPLIDREGNLAGVEALLRWEHPEKGFISPARFIPLAETTGQIIPISEWVLKRACLDMQLLNQQGLGAIRVAVNLSPLQFQRSSFLANLRQTLLMTGLPAEQLSLELTEGILMDNTEGAIDTLHALRSMNVGVSIDDFGTGYSSLSYLKHLPISTVKIDRSFINELNNSEDDAAIVQGIISMAHHLGLKVVAEGVETEEQYQRLMTYQCDFFQGYGLAKPMPLEELETFVMDLSCKE
ncbi:sensor domain-containing phosphodiesterase [Vreelandella populi]|uniref:sensor domain-containing phosphodiesterase n=1 Tax=Vreelandella populi TaxID=2498858 RepID=UPI000F8F5E58|nr:EAL domain-containing protein [Halomonas populi]RUR41246.1 EAL domain-containing protein [Halomonas populi]